MISYLQRFSSIKHLLGHSIIQFGPIRSGSTLVFNILREVFPDQHIQKTHTLKGIYLKRPMVITYRHPLDSIASSIQRYGLTPTDEIVAQQIQEFNSNGFSDLVKIKDPTKVLMLRYEDFRYDLDVVFNGIESFFDIKITDKKRDDLSKFYNIESVKKMTESKKTFSDHDRITHWHGKHVSKYNGGVNYHKEFFSQSQLDQLLEIYSEFLVANGYS